MKSASGHIDQEIAWFIGSDPATTLEEFKARLTSRTSSLNERLQALRAGTPPEYAIYTEAVDAYLDASLQALGSIQELKSSIIELTPAIEKANERLGKHVTKEKALEAGRVAEDAIDRSVLAFDENRRTLTELLSARERAAAYFPERLLFDRGAAIRVRSKGESMRSDLTIKKATLQMMTSMIQLVP